MFAWSIRFDTQIRLVNTTQTTNQIELIYPKCKRLWLIKFRIYATATYIYVKSHGFWTLDF
jgi:hypothetical protein